MQKCTIVVYTTDDAATTDVAYQLIDSIEEILPMPKGEGMEHGVITFEEIMPLESGNPPASAYEKGAC